MKKLLLFLLSLWGLYTGISVFALSGDIFINDIPGVVAQVDVRCPQTSNERINRTLRNYISRQVNEFKNHALMIQSWSYAWVADDFSLNIDCKVVNNTGMVYSVLCDTYNSLWKNNQTHVAAFNFYKKTGKLIKLSDILTRGQLKRISWNLFNYFTVELQTVSNEDKVFLKKGLQPIRDNYNNFTIHASQSPTLILYFPWSQLLSWAGWNNRVKITYPEWRVVK